jgi:hypothetical protein
MKHFEMERCLAPGVTLTFTTTLRRHRFHPRPLHLVRSLFFAIQHCRQPQQDRRRACGTVHRAIAHCTAVLAKVRSGEGNMLRRRPSHKLHFLRIGNRSIRFDCVSAARSVSTRCVETRARSPLHGAHREAGFFRWPGSRRKQAVAVRTDCNAASTRQKCRQKSRQPAAGLVPVAEHIDLTSTPAGEAGIMHFACRYEPVKTAFRPPSPCSADNLSEASGPAAFSPQQLRGPAPPRVPKVPPTRTPGTEPHYYQWSRNPGKDKQTSTEYVEA